jgi:hypothetical protein
MFFSYSLLSAQRNRCENSSHLATQTNWSKRARTDYIRTGQHPIPFNKGESSNSVFPCSLTVLLVNPKYCSGWVHPCLPDPITPNTHSSPSYPFIPPPPSYGPIFSLSSMALWTREDDEDQMSSGNSYTIQRFSADQGANGKRPQIGPLSTEPISIHLRIVEL